MLRHPFLGVLNDAQATPNSSPTFNAQACPNAALKKLNNFLHTHSIFRWLDSLNKRTANCLNKRINSKPLNLHPYSVNDPSTLKASADGSIVITLARLTLTILQAQSIRSRLNC
jgi:hypothetical protein